MPAEGTLDVLPGLSVTGEQRCFHQPREGPPGPGTALGLAESGQAALTPPSLGLCVCDSVFPGGSRPSSVRSLGAPPIVTRMIPEWVSAVERQGRAGHRLSL